MSSTKFHHPNRPFFLVSLLLMLTVTASIGAVSQASQSSANLSDAKDQPLGISTTSEGLLAQVQEAGQVRCLSTCNDNHHATLACGDGVSMALCASLTEGVCADHAGTLLLICIDTAN